MSRKRDLSEKVLIALVIALMVCTGMHSPAAERMLSVAFGPMGCAGTPAYSIGLHAAIADDSDHLPKTGGYSRQPTTPPVASPPPPAPSTPPAGATPASPSANPAAPR
jgi:hypothetical protein